MKRKTRVRPDLLLLYGSHCDWYNTTEMLWYCWLLWVSFHGQWDQNNSWSRTEQHYCLRWYGSLFSPSPPVILISPVRLIIWPLNNLLKSLWNRPISSAGFIVTLFFSYSGAVWWNGCWTFFPSKLVNYQSYIIAVLILFHKANHYQ